LLYKRGEEGATAAAAAAAASAGGPENGRGAIFASGQHAVFARQPLLQLGVLRIRAVVGGGT